MVGAIWKTLQMPERRFLVQLDYYPFRRDGKPDTTVLEMGASLLEFYQRNQGDFYFEVKVIKELK
jgi:hypothetical protein